MIDYEFMKIWVWEENYDFINVNLWKYMHDL